MTILVVFVSCSKLADFLHAAFILVEKHHPVFFFTGLLFVFEILRMETMLSFPSGIFWRSIVKRKTKQTFCFAKVTIPQLFLIAASLAQVVNAPNEAYSNFFCRDTRGLDSRSVKSFFLFCFSSSFKNLLSVLVIELPFLLVRIWMICFF